MATVTQTYIRVMDVIDPSIHWPVGALQEYLDSGALISNSEVRIADGEPGYVEGKNKTKITRVWRSIEDKNNFEAAGLANTARQAFATRHNVRKINEVIS
jgi:hypothetical protein